MNRIKEFLMSLSFRTGIIILLSCIPLYLLSFAQMSLPISSTMKWGLWVVLFGAAKTTQYAGLTILGVEGVKRLKRAIRRRKGLKESAANS